jgi:hypothetical protein
MLMHARASTTSLWYTCTASPATLFGWKANPHSFVLQLSNQIGTPEISKKNSLKVPTSGYSSVSPMKTLYLGWVSLIQLCQKGLWTWMGVIIFQDSPIMWQDNNQPRPHHSNQFPEFGCHRSCLVINGHCQTIRTGGLKESPQGFLYGLFDVTPTISSCFPVTKPFHNLLCGPPVHMIPDLLGMDSSAPE